MSRNTALITDAAQLQAKSDLDAYAAGVAAHVGGDWGQHRQLAQYSQSYVCAAGGISTNVLRMLLTDNDTDLAVIVPAFDAGPAPSTGLPIIALQPVSQSVPLGQPFQLVIFAASDISVTYQWQLNGVDIANAVDSTYTVTAATAAPAGGLNYRCVVSNQRGVIYSDSALITVT